MDLQFFNGTQHSLSQQQQQQQQHHHHQQQQPLPLPPSWSTSGIHGADRRVLFVTALAVTWLAEHLSATVLGRCYETRSGKTLESMRRLSRDLGLTPIRLALVGLNFFCLRQFLSVSPIISRAEFDQAQLSWVVLAAGYTSELAGYVGELRGSGISYAISLMHHVVAMVVAVCVNRCMPYSLSGGSCHWLRMLSGMIVFAVALGGMFTSLLRILYFHDRVSTDATHGQGQGQGQGQAARVPAAPLVCWAALVLTWALTGTIARAWWEIISLYHIHGDDMYGFLGRPTVAAISVAFFFFWVQWKWVVLWHAKMMRLWRPQKPVQHLLSLQQMPVLCVAGGLLVGLISVACVIAAQSVAARVVVSVHWL